MIIKGYVPCKRRYRTARIKVILVIRKFYNGLRKVDYKYTYVMKMAAEQTHQFGKEKNHRDNG